MKLSQMTTEQLKAKQTRIAKILAERQNSFIERLVASHDKILQAHEAAGGKILRRTFPELLNAVGYDPEGGTDDDESVRGERIYVSSSSWEDASSIFGDVADYDQAEHSFVERRRSAPRRQWMVARIKNPRTQVRWRLLTETEVRALLRALG